MTRSGPDDRRALVGSIEPMDSRADDRIHGGTQQPVLGCEAQSSPVSDSGIHDHHGLLRRRETHPAVPLTYWK
jgi:hypothetical protein